jgi:hypothetical protein
MWDLATEGPVGRRVRGIWQAPAKSPGRPDAQRERGERAGIKGRERQRGLPTIPEVACRESGGA